MPLLRRDGGLGAERTYDEDQLHSSKANLHTINQMNKKLIILHGIYLSAYDGTLKGFYPGGFKWAAEHGWGGEVLNFKPAFGRCYGYVETLERSVHIEKLGASQNSTSINDVTVVWTAPDPSPRRGRIVVGWYLKATLYRNRQQPDGTLKHARTFLEPISQEHHTLSFQVEALQKNCILLAPEERVLWIPPRKKGDKGIPGQSPVYFPDLQTTVGPEIARRIRLFINTGEALSLADTVAPKRMQGSGRHEPDPERRKKIETASMNFVINHFEAMNYVVKDVSEKNVGYDLIATKGDTTLCIEVKGRSGTEITADFTFNEFDKIRLEECGKFNDGSYRICIVTDALNEESKIKLHHFWHVNPTPVEKARGVQPAWQNIDGIGILEMFPREAAQGRLRRPIP